MTVSSRTPEGLPSKCTLCGAHANVDFSEPASDAPCPSCGHLLWASAQLIQSIKKHYEDTLGISSSDIRADTRFSDLEADSLDTVEMVMELEEEFGINFSDDAATRIRTIADAVRYIQDHGH